MIIEGRIVEVGDLEATGTPGVALITSLGGDVCITGLTELQATEFAGYLYKSIAIEITCKESG